MQFQLCLIHQRICVLKGVLLVQLSFLDLGGNDLTGPLPVIVGSLTNVSTVFGLDLSVGCLSLVTTLPMLTAEHRVTDSQAQKLVHRKVTIQAELTLHCLVYYEVAVCHGGKSPHMNSLVFEFARFQWLFCL